MFDFRADVDCDFGAIVSAGEKAFRLRDGDELSLIIVASKERYYSKASEYRDAY
jgi:hypothetical protein